MEFVNFKSKADAAKLAAHLKRQLANAKKAGEPFNINAQSLVELGYLRKAVELLVDELEADTKIIIIY